MARNPTPTALKVLRGNPSKRPLNKHEPKPMALDRQKEPPTWLSLTTRAKRIYRSVLPTIPKGLLSIVDEALFVRWCELNCDRTDLRQYIRSNGRTLELFDSKGNLRTVKLRPEVSDLRCVELELRGIESQMGFTPSSRSKVVCVEQNLNLDELDEEMFG